MRGKPYPCPCTLVANCLFLQQWKLEPSSRFQQWLRDGGGSCSTWRDFAMSQPTEESSSWKHGNPYLTNGLLPARKLTSSLKTPCIIMWWWGGFRFVKGKINGRKNTAWFINCLSCSVLPIKKMKSKNKSRFKTSKRWICIHPKGF